MRRPPLALAVVLAAAAGCDCGGGALPVVWIGAAGEARVLAVGEAGERLGTVAGSPALDAPVRALLARRDGVVVALEDAEAGATPAVLLSRAGERLAAFDARDGAGAPLFPAGTRAWALAEGEGGVVWVTGGTAPALFDADGRFLRRAATLPYATRGIAALPDGRMLVGHGVQGLALYRPDGALAGAVSAPFASEAGYQGVDALLARPDGTILVAVARVGLTVDGVVVPAALEGATLVARRPLADCVHLGYVPSALAGGGTLLVAGPPLGTLAPATCAERLTPDASARLGCLAPGVQRAVAWLGAP